MTKNKLLVKELDEFMKKQWVHFASIRRRHLYVSIHAGPNVKRYRVVEGDQVKEFAKKGDAVRFFNEG